MYGMYALRKNGKYFNCIVCGEPCFNADSADSWDVKVFKEKLMAIEIANECGALHRLRLNVLSIA